ncbi:MAG: hypothetical protein ACRDJH_15095 [Thermomicrobiales bacterium]
MSPARRRRNHLHVARALERLHPHDPGPLSGQVAAHFEQAGAADQAVTWYVRAAEAAQQLHANGEAVRLWGRALDLLRAQPETAERMAREFALLAALLAPLGAVEGFASGRLAELQRHALAVARTLGVEPAPQLLRSLAIASLSHADFEAAQRFGEQLQARGARDGDDVLVVEGEYVLGVASFWTCEFDDARRHFGAAVERYRPEHRCTHLVRYGFDPKVICLSRLGNTLWYLGRPAEACRARDAALALADEIGHPVSRAIALVFAGMLAIEMGDHERVRADAAALAAEHEEHAGMQPRITAEALAGFIDVLDGQEEIGIARIRRTLDDVRGSDHAPGMRACLVRVLLEACAVAGKPREGLVTVDLALRLGNAARICEAEAHRLRAEFLAALGASEQEIETELGRALEIAHRQGAISLELRVASSLLRWRLAGGDGSGASEARALLAAIVARLPEARDLHLPPEVAEPRDRG